MSGLFIYENTVYDLTVVLEPEGKYRCYGVVNRQTGVVEAYISQLAKAKQIADRFERNLKVGLKDEAEEFKKALQEIAHAGGPAKKGEILQ